MISSCQITDFADGAALDEQIQKLALAGGDGLCGCTEAYCLAAYFFVHRMDFPEVLHKPFLFLSADERPYAVVGGTLCFAVCHSCLPCGVTLSLSPVRGHSVSLSLSLSLSLCPCHCHSVSVTVTLSLSLSLCLCHCQSVSCHCQVGGEPDGSNVTRFLGGEAQAAISTGQVFQQLRHKYEVLVLHQTPPHKVWVKQSG